MTIRIVTNPEYLADKSKPQEQRFVFAYTIEIINESEEPATLLGRHWFIHDANEQLQEVQGKGVVGEQPTIAPGESYRYSSGAILETETGTMEGSYQMVSESGQLFDAPIPMFALVPAHSWH